MSGVRELPESYTVREFISKEEGWQLERVVFLDVTRAAWDERKDVWSEFWYVAVRWATLFDKFARTSSEKVSAEMRQLESSLDRLVAARGEGEGSATESRVVDELKAKRASRAGIAL